MWMHENGRHEEGRHEEGRHEAMQNEIWFWVKICNICKQNTAGLSSSIMAPFTLENLWQKYNTLNSMKYHNITFNNEKSDL